MTARKRTSWKKVGLRLFLLLVLVLAGTFTWLINDTQFSKRLVEKQLTKLTHRTFKIEGDFDFKLGRDLKVTAAGIKWANASWAASANMLEVGRAVVVVDLWSLIKPPVVLRDVSIENATLDFGWSEEKYSNWYLGDRSKAKKAPLESLPLLLDKADIKDLNLMFRHPALTDDLLIKVAHVRHQSNSDADLVVDIEANAQGNALTLVGDIGPFPKLIVAGAVEFDLTATGEKSRLSMKGSTPRLSKLDFTDLQADLQSSEIAKLLAVLKLPVITHGAADLDLDYQTDNSRVDGKIKGNMGEFDLDVVMHAANMQNWQGIVLNAKSKGPSALAAGKLVGIDFLPAEPYQLEIKIQDSGQGLLIDAAHFATAGAVVTATGSIKGFPKLTGIQLDFAANAASLKPFTSALADHNLPDLPLQVKGNIDRENADSSDKLDLMIKLGEIDASLNGHLSEKEGFNGSVFQYTLSIPDSLMLKELFSLPVRSSVPVTFAGGLEVEDTGPFLTKTAGHIGDNQFSLGSDIPLRTIKDKFSSTIEVSGPNAAAAVGVFGDIGKFPPSAFSLSGNVGLTGKKITFSPLQAHLGDNQFKINGSLELSPGHPLSSFEFSAQGPDLNNVVSSFGFEGAPAKPYSTTGLLQMTEQSIDVSNLVLHIGNSQIKGAVSSGWPSQPENLSFDVSGSGQNLQESLPEIPHYTPVKVAFNFQAKGKADQKNIAIEAAEVRVGSTSFSFAGQVGMAPQWSANQVRLTASGDHLSDLGVVYGWQFADSTFNFSATMSGQENELSINDLLLKVGANDLQGKLHLKMQEKPELNVDISSTHLDLRDLLVKNEDQKSGKEAAVESGANKDRLIPVLDIPFEKLDLFNGTFTISLDRLLSKKLDLSNARLQATLDNGWLKAPVFSAQSASAAGRGVSGGISGKLQIQADPQNSQVDIWLNAENLVVVQQALDKYMSKNNPGQKIDLHLSGKGNSLRDLAASLNGYAWFQGGERQIEAEVLNVLYGDLLTQVFTTVLPFSKSSKTQTLICDRIFFEAKNGLLETAPSILFRTDKLDIEAIGLINLASEEINFNIQSAPRQGLGMSTGDLVNSFFRFQGTLAKPKLQLDPTGTLVEGGAAFATAGLSIVAKSLYKRWLKKELTCDELTEEARKMRAKIDPLEVPAN